MPHLNAALAVRGGKFMAMILADQIGRTEKTYDEMKSGILAMTEAVEASVRPAWEKQLGEGATECDLFVGGISETSGPDSFAVTRDRAYSPNGVWKLVDLGAIALAPGTDALQEKWAPQISSPSFDTRAAVSLMNDQRRLIGWSRDDTRVHVVGCFAQLTSIQKGHISSQLIHHWEDPIGELITAD